MESTHKEMVEKVGIEIDGNGLFVLREYFKDDAMVNAIFHFDNKDVFNKYFLNKSIDYKEFKFLWEYHCTGEFYNFRILYQGVQVYFKKEDSVIGEIVKTMNYYVKMDEELLTSKKKNVIEDKKAEIEGLKEEKLRLDNEITNLKKILNSFNSFMNGMKALMQ